MNQRELWPTSSPEADRPSRPADPATGASGHRERGLASRKRGARRANKNGQTRGLRVRAGEGVGEGAEVEAAEGAGVGAVRDLAHTARLGPPLRTIDDAIAHLGQALARLDGYIAEHAAELSVDELTKLASVYGMNLSRFVRMLRDRATASGDDATQLEAAIDAALALASERLGTDLTSTGGPSLAGRARSRTDP